MAGVAEEDGIEDQDKGELKYQESKQFNTEWFLCSAYDNENGRRVTFEIYGLDTQDMYHKVWDYSAFDNLFRFNAELMNPNRKEGRFHWIIERLAIITVNKKRELKLQPEPSEEVPQLPIYETTRKIPTGRMDLKERQRLREQMDMLDIRRAENIAKRRQATKQRVLQYIMHLKEEDVRRKEEQNAKIEEERKLRVKTKEEQEKKEREAEAELEAKRKQRRKNVEVKEERSEEHDEEEYRQLRARWRVKDAERAKLLADQKEKVERERQAQKDAEFEKQRKMEKVAANREVAWAAHEERHRKKATAKINEVLEILQVRERQDKLRLERNKEFLQLLHSERQPIFKEQLERTEERKKAQESEQEALANYKEKRAIPKKVNKKSSKRSKSATDEKSSTAMTKPKGKSKSKSKSAESEGEGLGEPSDEDVKPKGKALDPDKVLDAVEAKMRKEMEEARKREIKQKKRDKKINEREASRIEKENQHMASVREQYRQNVTVKDSNSAERRLIMAQRDKETEMSAVRKSQERARLEHAREINIAKKEKQRFEAMCVAAAA